MNPSTTSEPQRTYTVPSIPSPVVTIHAGPTVVKAPASVVFETLSDVSTWSKWNTFVPKCDIIARSQNLAGSEDETTSDPKLSVGDIIRFHVAIGVPVRVTYVVNKVTRPHDPVKLSGSPSAKDMYTINWKNPSFTQSWILSWLIRFERTHEIRILDEGSCEVETWDCQAGPSAYMVKWLLTKRLNKEFEKWVEGLKDYCEKY